MTQTVARRSETSAIELIGHRDRKRLHVNRVFVSNTFVRNRIPWDRPRGPLMCVISLVAFHAILQLGKRVFGPPFLVRFESCT
jgi:hypothetical protein